MTIYGANVLADRLPLFSAQHPQMHFVAVGDGLLQYGFERGDVFQDEFRGEFDDVVAVFGVVVFIARAAAATVVAVAAIIVVKCVVIIVVINGDVVDVIRPGAQVLFQRFQKGEQRGGVMPGFGVEQVVRVAANFFDQVVVVAAGEHFLAEGVVINVFAEVGDAQFFTERIEVELEVVEAVQRLVVEGGAVWVHEVVGHGGCVCVRLRSWLPRVRAGCPG